MPVPTIYIEGLTKDGTAPDAKTVFVKFEVHYGQKLAQIELGAGEPQFDAEPGAEAFRRDLAELAKAIQEAVALPQGVRWHCRL